jgi:oxalate---CoA ligase
LAIPSVDQQNFTGGWFRTGDCGSMDRDGYLFIKGRAKEFINRGGTKIGPREIEEVLLDHSNVGEAVVFAMPDKLLGEEVAAAIVLRDPRASAETEIREFVSRQLSYFKVPRRLVFLDKIPKGPTGKPRRVGLAAELGLVEPREAHRKDVPLEASRTQLEDVFATMWARIIGIERVSVDDNFFEIGGDSLAAVEVIAATEQVTAQRLTIAAIFEAPTVTQFAALIEHSDPRGQSYVIPSKARDQNRRSFALMGASYLRLAECLGTDRPFLGLLHPKDAATSIEAMAQFSVVRRYNPTGHISSVDGALQA